MKKIAVLSMTFLFAVAVVQGQAPSTVKKEIKETKKELKTERVALRKLEGPIVSEKAKASFNSDFSGATNTVWKRVNTFDEVTFTNKGGQKMKAFYDWNGTLVGTTSTKTLADIPAKAQKEIKANYKDYVVGQVILFDDNETNNTDMLLYGNQFDDANNYFVEMAKGDKKIVIQVNMEGQIFFFKQL